MTVTTATARVVHNGNGSTIAFAVPFRFLENGHVAVFLRDAAGNQTQWVENTQYTLAGADQAGGGTLTVLTTPTDHTPAAAEKLVIVRAVPITQETDYVENDPFPAETHERALDKLTMVNQEQTERLDRTITIPETDTAAGSFVLPGDTARANLFMAFDALGNITVAAGTTPTSTPVSSFMESLLSAADAASARTQLDAQAALLTLLTADGDLLIRAAGALARLAKGTDGQFLKMVAGSPAWATETELASITVAPAAIANNATNPNTRIDIAAKTFRAKDDAANIVLPATTIDISTAGNGGRLDGESRDADTWYAVLAGTHTSDGAFVAGFKKSSAKPAAWDNYRRLGWARTNGSSNLIAFIQHDDRFQWSVPRTDYSAVNPGIAAVLRPLSAPPNTTASHSAELRDSSITAASRALITQTDQPDTVPSNSEWHMRTDDTSGPQNIFGEWKVDGASQVRTRLSYSDGGIVLSGCTHGWIDSRDRDD